MSKVTAENKAIGRAASAAFGGQPTVTRFWDEARVRHVDILQASDRPQAGVNSYSTIGLSDSPLYKDGKEYGVRAELVGAIGCSFRRFDNALATAAFCVMNSHWFCYPGAIFHGVLKMHRASSTMHHFLFTPPFLWEGTLNTLDLKTKKVAWLLAVPISDAELVFAKDNGPQALEDLLEERAIDLFDLERPSVL